ncbi:hypothetical protein HPB47_013169 [Ixodes persulcatus]|uniref:Uncharacterized protein n=1 Tax=Ixodes persulcatus TaxID=34615 RepID=A0AC60NRI7_IXOPE|nr:hypothetical protein HPB47_013169 [Ixodes persulcatus]
MSDTCSHCQSPFLEKNDGPVECSECACKYHFGKCAGVTKKSFSGKSEDSKTTWRCPTCRATGSRASNSGEEQSEIDVRALLASINQRLAGLPELKEKVDSMERSVQFLSKQFDDFEKTLKVHDAEIKELKRRVTDLEKKDELSRAANDQLQKEVNDLEFRSRRLNLEVHGIPEVQGENLIETLNNIAEKLEVPRLAESDVVALHRLPARQDHAPGIIVHFIRQQIKDTEYLRAAKDRAKERGYAFAWYANGKVLVRRTEGARAIQIKCLDDLDKL